MTGEFQSRLRLDEYIEDGKSIPDEWVVCQPLIYVSVAGQKYTTPKGFITDLASIPRMVKGVFDVNDESRAPAVIHDALYCFQYTTRAEADGIFLEALEARGVGLAKRRMMWAGVRAGGWLHWNKRKDSGLTKDFVPPSYFEDEK